MRPSPLRLPPHRWWIFVLLGVSAASVVARLAAHGDVRQALPVDAAALTVGAFIVFDAIRRSPGLSDRGRWWHFALIAILLLGAVRAVLWAAGVPVQYANLVVLGLGGLILAGWRVILARRKASAGFVARTVGSHQTRRPGD